MSVTLDLSSAKIEACVFLPAVLQPKSSLQKPRTKMPKFHNIQKRLLNFFKNLLQKILMLTPRRPICRARQLDMLSQYGEKTT